MKEETTWWTYCGIPSEPRKATPVFFFFCRSYFLVNTHLCFYICICKYIRIHVEMNVHIDIDIHIYVCMYVYVCIPSEPRKATPVFFFWQKLFSCEYTPMFIYSYICIYIHIHVEMNVHINIHIHMYVCMYMYAFPQSPARQRRYFFSFFTCCFLVNTLL